MQVDWTKFFDFLVPFLAILGGVKAIIEFLLPYLYPVKIELYNAEEIGLVASNTGFISKIHLRCNFVNNTPRSGTIQRLVIRVTNPESEILDFRWKLFYEYETGASAVKKRIDQIPVTISGKDYKESLFIEFEDSGSVPVDWWIPGEYEFEVLGWINRKRSGAKLNKFQVKISKDTQAQLKKSYREPTVIRVPILRTPKKLWV